MVISELKNVYKWEKHLSREQIERIIEIVHSLGIDVYLNNRLTKYINYDGK